MAECDRDLDRDLDQNLDLDQESDLDQHWDQEVDPEVAVAVEVVVGVGVAVAVAVEVGVGVGVAVAVAVAVVVVVPVAVAVAVEVGSWWRSGRGQVAVAVAFPVAVLVASAVGPQCYLPLPLHSFPPLRLRPANSAPVNASGRHVLYWMIAARRASWSFALDRAVALCRELGKPLLVLEPLRAGYPWASGRLHAFVLQGMAENAAAFAAAGVTYHPYVEPRPGAGRGLLEALAAQACAVVTDSFPSFFLPRMVAAAAARLQVRLEAVDGNGLLPIEAVPRAPLTAHAFRRALQRLLPGHLGAFPSARPLQAAGLRGARLPPGVARRWPRAPAALLRADPAALARLPIDHAVPPAPRRGGTTAARAALRAFVRRGLAGYPEDRSHPDLDAQSGLSPWLHFGHLSAHEAFRAVARAERWTPAALGSRRDGLPPWARATLERHAADPRPWRYTAAELEAAATHDPIWNAAQRQLRAEGRIHNQLRMLWGKKILEWSPDPRAAWEALVALNDRWALDGRDPCSCAGLGWCLGRFDRPWGPERPIFGTVRYMSSDAARRKLRLKSYLARYGGQAGP